MDTSTCEVKTARGSDEYARLAEMYILRLACGMQEGDISSASILGEAYSAVYGHGMRLILSRLEMLELLQLRLEEVKDCPPVVQGALFENLAPLGKYLGLHGVDEEILAFCAVARSCRSLRKILDDLGPLSGNRLAAIIALALDRSPWEIEARLADDGPLLRSALVTLRRNLWPFQDKFSFVLGLPDALMRPQSSLQELVSFALKPAPNALLSVDDYPHLTDEIELLCAYLRAAIKDRLAGVNILLHGPPGVGKTQLVRTVAQSIGCTLYEVTVSNALGDALTHKERHENYRFNQRFLSQQGNVVLLFDEAEEALQDRPLLRTLDGLERRQGKAWINALLEGNLVPAFWVVNSLSGMDAAVLRRFDYVIEMRNPPRSVRRRAIRQALGDMEVSDQWLDKHALDDEVSPAVVDRALRVLRSAGITDIESAGARFRAMVENVVVAQGKRLPARYPQPDDYNLECVNAGVDLKAVVRGFANRSRGRLLLHGPPGSGKTAFAHHLASQLDRPLLLKRASDLVSMWLGETEKNIARMFQQAADDHAVLLLDEADGFLRDRRSAVRSWEVTEVNELLSRMECFEGIFLCATNFRETLDAAALRRFGMKIAFDYLSANQCWLMFASTCERLNGGGLTGAHEDNLRRQLGTLRNLTPGDFTAAAQHVELSEETATPEALLKAIIEESRGKPDGNRTAIGFMPSD